MNLPRGILKNTEECEHASPINYLSRIEPDFSGVIRFFERGQAWDVFFLLVEEGSIIGYYTTKGDASLEEKMQASIEGFEVEVRTFNLTEMQIARTLNHEYLLPAPLEIAKMGRELKINAHVRDLFPDASLVAEIKKAREFRENFRKKRTKEIPLPVE